MVAFVLDDLRGKPAKHLRARVPRGVEPGYLDAAIACTRARAVEREAGLLRIVRVRAFENLGVEHYERTPVVVDGNDPFANAYHVGGEPYALMRMGGKRVCQVAPDADIFWCGRHAGHAQHDGRVDDVANHGFPLWIDRGRLRVSVAH